ncbi:MAG: hypothetical protein H6728_06400 [Myxococcales bacterium]|nr:hypothetical protein [Myxococcales bacterium]MCB9642690.1 hypothetical protein [Myxococcales bacterium]
MTETPDSRVDIAHLQKQIQDMLGVDSDHLMFEYKQVDGLIHLALVTINPRHRQSFLFHQTRGVDKIDALKKLVEYVKQTRPSENSYTIQWRSKDGADLQTSYFSARNIYEALDKLYYGRDINAITVYIVKLNPQA